LEGSCTARSGNDGSGSTTALDQKEVKEKVKEGWRAVVLPGQVMMEAAVQLP
jgi:hypothetical protein